MDLWAWRLSCKILMRKYQIKKFSLCNHLVRRYMGLQCFMARTNVSRRDSNSVCVDKRRLLLYVWGTFKSSWIVCVVSRKLAFEAITMLCCTSSLVFSLNDTRPQFLLVSSCWNHVSSLPLRAVIGRLICRSLFHHLLLGRLPDASYSGSKVINIGLSLLGGKHRCDLTS